MPTTVNETCCQPTDVLRETRRLSTISNYVDISVYCRVYSAYEYHYQSEREYP